MGKARVKEKKTGGVQPQAGKYIHLLSLATYTFEATSNAVTNVLANLLVTGAKTTANSVRTFHRAFNEAIDAFSKLSDENKIRYIQKMVDDIGDNSEAKLRTCIKSVNLDMLEQIHKKYRESQHMGSNTSIPTMLLLKAVKEMIPPQARANFLLTYMFEKENWKRRFCFTLWMHIPYLISEQLTQRCGDEKKGRKSS